MAPSVEAKDQGQYARESTDSTPAHVVEIWGFVGGGKRDARLVVPFLDQP
jgi:hypothetical protein